MVIFHIVPKKKLKELENLRPDVKDFIAKTRDLRLVFSQKKNEGMEAIREYSDLIRTEII